MALRDWKSVITKDFPDPGPVVVEAGRDVRGVWDDSEYEARRDKVLNTPLP